MTTEPTAMVAGRAVPVTDTGLGPLGDDFDPTEDTSGLARPEVDRIADARAFLADMDNFYRAAFDKFDGAAWHRLGRAFGDVAVPFLTHWITTGKINRLCREKEIHGTPPVTSAVDPMLAHELACLTVAEALARFRRRVLLGRIWTPGSGASLLTFFVNACLLEYRATVRKWLDEEMRFELRLDPATIDPLVPAGPDSTETVIDHVAALQELSALDSTTARILFLDGLDFRDYEIAQMLGLSVGAVEQRLVRYRRRRARSA